MPTSVERAGTNFTVTQSSVASPSAALIEIPEGLFQRHGNPFSRTGEGIEGYTSHSRVNTGASQRQGVGRGPSISTSKLFGRFHLDLGKGIRNTFRFGFNRQLFWFLGGESIFG